ncbi:MAG: hypothetical protein O7B99_07255 [Planctomycetota bacterium]|nr:hypothetical protein [Planctomycetota bacterium]
MKIDLKRTQRRRSGREGFTLAEAAVTIAIVAITLTTVMQVLQGTKLTAAHTYNIKVARELALLTLGDIQQGLWWDDIETLRTGSYADQDYPDFYFEIALGDEAFLEYEETDDPYARFDNWAYKRQQERDQEFYDDEESEEGEVTEPYEEVRIRVTFPKLRQFSNEVILERWVRWEQVYGEEEEEEEEEGEGESGEAGDPAGSAGAGGAASPGEGDK